MGTHFRQGLERICGLLAEHSMSQIPFYFSMSVDELKSKKRCEAVPPMLFVFNLGLGPEVKQCLQPTKIMLNSVSEEKFTGGYMKDFFVELRKEVIKKFLIITMCYGVWLVWSSLSWHVIIVILCVSTFYTHSLFAVCNSKTEKQIQTACIYIALIEDYIIRRLKKLWTSFNQLT